MDFKSLKLLSQNGSKKIQEDLAISQIEITIITLGYMQEASKALKNIKMNYPLTVICLI